MNLEIENKVYCSYCFNTINDSDCNCGYCNNKKQFLPIGHILNGTIIVGALRKSTGYYSEYYGFDGNTKAKLLIKEFNPTVIASRTENGSLMIKHGYENSYNNALSLFINRMQILQAEKNAKTVFDVKYAFLQNNTSYYVTEYNDEMLLKDWFNSPITVSQKLLLDSLYNCLLLLKTIHNKGFIHGNISDDTVYVSEKGLIIDGFEPTTDELGILIKEPLVYEKSINYLPLSYFNGAKNERTTDFFSLGLIMYSLLTGEKPGMPFSDKSQIDLTELKKRGIDSRLFNVISGMCMVGEKIYFYEDEIIKDLLPLFKKNGIEVKFDYKEYEHTPKKSTDNINSIITVNREYDVRKRSKNLPVIAILAVIVLLLVLFFVFENKNHNIQNGIFPSKASEITVQQTPEKTTR